VTPAESRYSGIAIALHWAMALLILFMIWLGHNMENHESRFQLHKSIGITLLVLTIARIVWRLYNKPPALPNDIKPYEARLSKLVQFGFYALMLLIPLGGWLMVSVSPFAVPTVLFETISWPSLPLSRDEQSYKFLAFFHGKGATIGFLGLLFLHVAGAIKHEIGHESGVINRGLPGRKTDTAHKFKGMLPMLLVSLGFFAAMAAIPIVSANGTSETTNQIAQPSFEANWSVVDENKSISFNFSHDGADYTGHFENWNAKIEFYKEELSRSQVQVEIDLTSAVTGKKLYDDSLGAPEWFDAKTKAQATVTLDNFVSAGGPDKYSARATLNLKGIHVSSPFVFDLQINGDEAKMTGSTTFTRKDLNLGQDSDPDADWVSETIVIGVKLEAKRLAN